MNYKNKSGVEIISDLIIEKIIKKEIFPNSQIIETKLAEETGISRTPIRQALKELSYKGFVNIIPNRGAFVSNPNLEEIKSVYNCKMVLESAAIKDAFNNITNIEINKLENILNEGIEKHTNKDLYNFISLNEEFHMVIAKASKNIYYEKYIKELIQKSNIYLIFYDKFMITQINDSEAIKEHYKIIDALKSRDVEACVQASIRHNQKTLYQLSLNGKVY